MRLLAFIAPKMFAALEILSQLEAVGAHENVVHLPGIKFLFILRKSGFWKTTILKGWAIASASTRYQLALYNQRRIHLTEHARKSGSQ
jgi:hypothetical protein